MSSCRRTWLLPYKWPQWSVWLLTDQQRHEVTTTLRHHIGVNWQYTISNLNAYNVQHTKWMPKARATSETPQYLLSVNDFHDLVLEVFVEDVAGHLTRSLNCLYLVLLFRRHDVCKWVAHVHLRIKMNTAHRDMLLSWSTLWRMHSGRYASVFSLHTVR